MLMASAGTLYRLVPAHFYPGMGSDGINVTMQYRNMREHSRL